MPDTKLDHRRMTELLEDFYRLTRIRISFWSPESRKCAVGPSSGNCAFCEALRANPEFDAACRDCDARALTAAACEPDRLHVFRCRAGMNEYVYPAVFDGQLLGFFMYGQVRIIDARSAARDEQTRRELYDSLGLCFDEMESLYAQMPPVTEEMMLSAGRMLSALASFSYLNGLVRQQKMPLAQRIDRYIRLHYAENITVEDACQTLHISRSTLCHALQNSGAGSFVTLLNHQRIEAVRQALQNGESPAQAAAACGYQSVEYMSRIFKRETGMTPGQFVRSLMEN